MLPALPRANAARTSLTPEHRHPHPALPLALTHKRRQPWRAPRARRTAGGAAPPQLPASSPLPPPSACRAPSATPSTASPPAHLPASPATAVRARPTFRAQGCSARRSFAPPLAPAACCNRRPCAPRDRESPLFGQTHAESPRLRRCSGHANESCCE
eukprot:2022523-Rhodomonas_salina.1